MDVKTICGCTLTCDWPRGDRRVQCGHGRWWVVRRDESTTEQFKLAKETFPS